MIGMGRRGRHDQELRSTSRHRQPAVIRCRAYRVKDPRLASTSWNLHPYTHRFEPYKQFMTQ